MNNYEYFITHLIFFLFRSFLFFFFTKYFLVVVFVNEYLWFACVCVLCKAFNKCYSRKHHAILAFSIDVVGVGACVIIMSRLIILIWNAFCLHNHLTEKHMVEYICRNDRQREREMKVEIPSGSSDNRMKKSIEFVLVNMCFNQGESNRKMTVKNYY